MFPLNNLDITELIIDTKTERWALMSTFNILFGNSSIQYFAYPMIEIINEYLTNNKNPTYQKSCNGQI